MRSPARSARKALLMRRGFAVCAGRG
jgi:hypothetical protein